MKKIVITTTSFAEYDSVCLEKLRSKGFEVVLNPYKRKISSDELILLAKDAVGIIAGTESITKEALLKLPGLKVISRCGAGLDNVDLDAARELNIKVLNTPDAPTLAVAELTVGLILSLLRKICQSDRSTKVGGWEKIMGNLLREKKAGIIGFGKIGRKVAQILGSFGCEVAYYDPYIENGISGFKQLEKRELLSWAEVISIHISTKERILNEKEFRLMKKGSWLVNMSRGEVLDEAALYAHLTNGHLGGAALDVFQHEPYTGPLSKLDNIILTPHVGSYAKETRIEMEILAADNLLRGLAEREQE